VNVAIACLSNGSFLSTVRVSMSYPDTFIPDSSFLSITNSYVFIMQDSEESEEEEPVPKKPTSVKKLGGFASSKQKE
jgi:hypothetical protein